MAREATLAITASIHESYTRFMRLTSQPFACAKGPGLQGSHPKIPFRAESIWVAIPSGGWQVRRTNGNRERSSSRMCASGQYSRYR